MEKRLFLAVGLSLLVVFFFQTFFTPKSPAPNGVDYLSESGKTTQPPKLQTPVATNEKPGFSEVLTKVNLGGYELTTTNVGGNIKNITITDQHYSFLVKDLGALKSFQAQEFTFSRVSPNSFQYTANTKLWKITKTFTLSSKNTIDVSLDIKNTSNGPASLTDALYVYSIDATRLDNSVSGADRTLIEYAILTDKKIFRKSNAVQFNDKWTLTQSDIVVKWLGYRDRYFALVAQPAFEVNSFLVTPAHEKELGVGFPVSLLNVPSGETKSFNLHTYLGPQSPNELKAAGHNFSKIMVFSDWGWLDAISMGIYWALAALHNVLPVWGLCIIIISLIIYGLMYPLTLKSLLSMRKMQAVQPKIKQIQEKYKNNPEKLNQEIALCYKQNNVNPLSGCLPMLLQMPIFVGLYQVLWRSYYFREQGFLWMKDLSQPDNLFKLPFEIPWLGEYFNLLPILMIGIMALQQQMSLKSVSADPEQLSQQKMMAFVFPWLIGFIFYNFSSGLNLYFVVFYLLSAVTQWKISKVKFD